MGFKEEILKARKEKLGLDKVDTKRVLDCILNAYKEIILDAPRNIIGYSIDIFISNMNNYNKLGNIENLYAKWGDNFYVDLNNSVFFEMEVDEEGNLNGDNEEKVYFRDRDELKEIENISFSLKEVIDYCKENDFKIRLCGSDIYDSPTAVEIEPYESYDENNESVNCYLNSIK